MALVAVAIATPPRVDLTVTGAPVGAARMELSRTVDGDRWLVRGASTALIGGAATLTDYEVPTGRSFSYVAEIYDSAGGLLTTWTATVDAASLPDPDPSMAWLSDPLDQSSAVLITLGLGTDEQRSNGLDSVLVRPLGDEWGIQSIGPQSRLTDWPIRVIFEDAEAAQNVNELRRHGGLFCLRLPSKHRLPPVLYGALLVAEQVDPWADWYSELSGVFRPSRGTSLAPTVYAWSYDDTTALGGTYTASTSRWPTYAERVRGA